MITQRPGGADPIVVQTSLTRGPIPLVTEAGSGSLLKDIMGFVACRQTIGTDGDGDAKVTADQHGAIEGGFYQNKSASTPAGRDSWHFAMLATVTAVSVASGVKVKQTRDDAAVSSGAATLAPVFAGAHRFTGDNQGDARVDDFGLVVGDGSGQIAFIPGAKPIIIDPDTSPASNLGTHVYNASGGSAYQASGANAGFSDFFRVLDATGGGKVLTADMARSMFSANTAASGWKYGTFDFQDAASPSLTDDSGGVTPLYLQVKRVPPAVSGGAWVEYIVIDANRWA